jgi:hypothetical protein
MVCFAQPLQAESLKAFKQRYSQATKAQASDPSRAAAELRVLADEGYARAIDRLAYFHLKGIGVEKDAETSVALYRQAIAEGNTKSLISLGKVHLTIGEPEMAEAALLRASEAGIAKADATLAWAHATGRLGTRSDTSKGLEDLRRLAAADLQEAQTHLLAALIAQPDQPLMIKSVLSRLHSRVMSGDSKAAEALLRFYRLRGHPMGTTKVRAELLETPGIRPKIKTEEGLYLALNLQADHFWLASENIVRSAPNGVFPRALSVTARLNKNAYVRIVQLELEALGYKTGRPSPYLNATLIRSINEFCRDNGIQKDCKYGPLKSTTVKALAAKLAELRDIG